MVIFHQFFHQKTWIVQPVWRSNSSQTTCGMCIFFCSPTFVWPETILDSRVWLLFLYASACRTLPSYNLNYSSFSPTYLHILFEPKCLSLPCAICTDFNGRDRAPITLVDSFLILPLPSRCSWLPGQLSEPVYFFKPLCTSLHVHVTISCAIQCCSAWMIITIDNV
jgi:hypothetical protein